MAFVNPGFSPFQDSTIWPGSLLAVGPELVHQNIATYVTSVAWPTAAKALYIPFWVSRPRTVYQVGWINGTAPGTNVREAGVYDSGGSKLITGSSGSVAHTANVAERIDVTDTVILAGQYWLAVQCSSVDTWAAWNTMIAPVCASMGILTQTSANPLPTTATFVLDQTLAFIPYVFVELRPVL